MEHKGQRDCLQRHLKEQGSPSMVYYARPLHTQTVFANLGQDPSGFPNSRKAAETVLSLPIHPYLDKANVEKVTRMIASNS